MKEKITSLYMCFIIFLDLENIGKDIKIIEIGALTPILWEKTCFVAAILMFLIFGGNEWFDVMVPAIYGCSIFKRP